MQAKIYQRDQHGIRKELIDKDALFVAERLQDAGYIAYLVGGSVRDLLLNTAPKDFDIATSARPEQVKQVFRNCLLIGRRFRLAHVRFGPKVIEVATFRSGDIEDPELIVQDNTWGTPEEDVMRRDFTINGLFYDPKKDTVIDYIGGYSDTKRKLLRTIGQPSARFLQDPVRMLRMLKFKARYEFDIEEDSLHALIEHKHEISKSAPARVLEEVMRMLESGASYRFFELLRDTELLRSLFPTLQDFLCSPYGHHGLSCLACVDELILEARRENLPKQRFPREVLFGALLYPKFEWRIKAELMAEEKPLSHGQIMAIADDLINTATDSFYHFPKKLRAALHYILHQQYRLTPIQEGRSQTRILKHKEFPLALELLKIRALADPDCESHYERWLKLFEKNKPQRRSRPHPSPIPHENSPKSSPEKSSTNLPTNTRKNSAEKSPKDAPTQPRTAPTLLPPPPLLVRKKPNPSQQEP